MARRRLQLILATTTITVGLAVAPAAAQELGGLTEAVEDVVDTVEETGAPSRDTTASADDPVLDVDEGTDDGTLEVDVQVDVAPSDDDGSPQLESDGGVTVGDQHLDVGGATDPVEDAVDPDHDGDTSGTDTGDGSRPAGPGGFLAGGGVMAAGDDARPAGSTSDEPAARGDGFAAFGALDRGGFGATRYGGGTMTLDQVPDPEVAPPDGDPMEAPQVLDPEFAPETPAVLASGTSDGPTSGLLKALAAAMVLGTGAIWTRATEGGQPV